MDIFDDIDDDLGFVRRQLDRLNDFRYSSIWTPKDEFHYRRLCQSEARLLEEAMGSGAS
jgi:hypothetical protein